MFTGRKIVSVIGRLLEQTRHGTWVSRLPARCGIYLVMLGEDAELLAWMLPPADRLPKQTATGHAAMPVLITDHPGAAREASAKGFPVIQLNASHLRTRSAQPWFVNLVRAQWAQIHPRGLILTPGFFTALSRSRWVLSQLWPELRRYRAERSLRVIVAENSDLMTKLFEVLWRVDADPAVMMDCYCMGMPEYIDYGGMLAEQSKARVHSLGVQIRPCTSARGWDPGRVYLYLSSPRMRRDVLATLRDLDDVHRWKTIVMLSPEQLNTEAIYPAVGLESWSEFHDLMRRHPGIVLADAEMPLLPLLDQSGPVALLRGPSASQVGLIRGSYFVREARWPIYSTSSAWAEAVRGNDLAAWWTPFADRRCSLEQPTVPDFTQGFLDQVYAPLLEP